jgi:hypothetical protein
VRQAVKTAGGIRPFCERHGAFLRFDFTVAAGIAELQNQRIILVRHPLAALSVQASPSMASISTAPSSTASASTASAKGHGGNGGGGNGGGGEDFQPGAAFYRALVATLEAEAVAQAGAERARPTPVDALRFAQLPRHQWPRGLLRKVYRRLADQVDATTADTMRRGLLMSSVQSMHVSLLTGLSDNFPIRNGGVNSSVDFLFSMFL